MKVKTKRWIAALSFVLCLLLSVGYSILLFSADNLENIIKKADTVELKAESLTLQGWTLNEDGALVAGEHASVSVKCEAPVFVNNILLQGDAQGVPELVTVRYTDAAGNAASQTAPVQIKNQDTYVLLEKTVTELQLELSAQQSLTVALQGLVLNPQKLNVNWQALVLIFLLSFLTVLFVLELVCNWDNFKKTVLSLKKYRYLLNDLVSRDVKTKYRRSVLGIVWSVLNPLLMMLVLTAVFSNIFRFAIEDFPVYYLTGYILFNFVSEATNFSMTSIVGAAGLIKKVYIPKIIFPLEKCLYALVNFLFSLIAAVVVFLVVGVTPSLTMLLFFVPVLYLFVFNFGFSLILATLNTFFRDAGYLYGVFTTLWVYLTPIIYPISILPGWMQSAVRFNPLYHYVEYFRAVTLYGRLPTLAENLTCIAYSLIFLLAGLLVFQKKQEKFIFYI